MGYESPITNIDLYQYGTDLIAANDDQTQTNSGSYVLGKQMVLNVKIYAYSNFLFNVDIKPTGGSAQAKLLLNGVELDSWSTGIAGFTTFSYDLVGEYWNVGDILEVYMKATPGGQLCDIKNMRLYGLRSPFYNSKKQV